MSDQQQAAMMVADDSYAGSATFTRLAAKLRDIFGMEHFLPAHQGRACEHILAKVFVQPGYVVPMNYHFTVGRRGQGQDAGLLCMHCVEQRWRLASGSMRPTVPVLQALAVSCLYDC
jgi:tryptophanase